MRSARIVVAEHNTPMTDDQNENLCKYDRPGESVLQSIADHGVHSLAEPDEMSTVFYEQGTRV